MGHQHPHLLRPRQPQNPSLNPKTVQPHPHGCPPVWAQYIVSAPSNANRANSMGDKSIFDDDSTPTGMGAIICARIYNARAINPNRWSKKRLFASAASCDDLVFWWWAHSKNAMVKYRLEHRIISARGILFAAINFFAKKKELPVKMGSSGYRRLCKWSISR